MPHPGPFSSGPAGGTPHRGTAAAGGGGGGGSGFGLTGRDFAALGLGGAGALSTFFGGNSSSDLDDVLRRVDTRSAGLDAQGEELVGLGTSGLQPALRFLTAITRGDPGAVGQATRPERARVIDQYDTARRAVAQFTPRGGGQTSAIAQSFTDEAGTLADIFATGRREGATALGQLSTRLAALGIQAEGLAGQNLSTLVQAYLSQDASARASSGAFGQSIGSLVGLMLFGPAGGAAGTAIGGALT